MSLIGDEEGVADVELTEQIRAASSVVYDLVSDVTRMGRWSPETTSCRWVGDATGPAVSARFRGTNKRGPMRWTTTCTVTAAEPGRRFAFDVDFVGVPISRWSYDLEPTADGRDRGLERPAGSPPQARVGPAHGRL